MCKTLMVKIYLVLPWKFFNVAFSLFVQCSTLIAGSMLHRLNKAYFKLFIVLSAMRRFLSNYLHENVSAIHQSALSALRMTK